MVYTYNLINASSGFILCLRQQRSSIHQSICLLYYHERYFLLQFYYAQFCSHFHK